jgi:CheY-like chemotaxis protein
VLLDVVMTGMDGFEVCIRRQVGECRRDISVSVGVMAAWGARYVEKRLGSGRFSDLARKMPLFFQAGQWPS